MKDRRDKIEKQNYAARVLGDLMGGRDSKTKLGKRSIDKLEEEEEEVVSEDEITISRKRDKKKKKSEKKEKKSKKSKKSASQERNALTMAQEFSQEYEPIKARRMKISTKETAELNSSLLSLDTSQDDKDYGLNVEVSGDVMKDLDEILNN